MATDSKPEIQKVLGDIDVNTSSDQLEKLRLLAASVVAFGLVESPSKKVPEIYRVIELDREKATAVAIFKRLLTKAGVSKTFVDKLSLFMNPSQPSEDIPKLYFYELLVKVSDHIGNDEYFRQLKNRIPDEKLEMNRDNIPSCVRLFQRLEMKNVLISEPAKERKASLELLERWLKDIHRNDVARIVREKIDEIPPPVEGQNESAPQGGIQPQGDGEIARPVEETSSN